MQSPAVLPDASWTRIANPAIPWFMNHYLKNVRKRLGLTMEQAAERVGTSAPQISRLEKSQRGLSWDWANRLARAYECDPVELMFGAAGPTVRVAGTIGRGAEVRPRAGDDVMVVKCPRGLNADTTVAAIVNGNVLLPLVSDGWFVFFRNVAEAKPDSLLNKAAIVDLTDGRRVFCYLQPGPTAGRFNINAPNTPPEESEVLSAFRVRAILPPDLVEVPTLEPDFDHDDDSNDIVSEESAPKARKMSA